MRHLNFGWILLVAAGLPAMAHAGTLQEQSSATIPIAGIRSLLVENTRGLVSVTRGGPGEIRLTALKVVRSNDARWAHRVLTGTQVVTENRGGQYVVRVVYPQRQAINIRFWDLFSDFELPRIEVRLALEIPDGLPIDLKSTSGDLETEGVRGSQHVESTSGDVSVRGAGAVHAQCTSGDVHIAGATSTYARSVSGDLVIDDTRGPVVASTTSGEIRVHGAADSIDLGTVSGDISVEQSLRGVRAETTSGDLELKRTAGRIEVRTTSGDLDLGVLAPFQGGSVATGSGTIKIHLADAVGCALDLSTTSGEIQVDVGLDVENVTRHKLSGLVHGGGKPLVVRTISGDVSILGGAR